ncbi:hypothetical protein KQI65_04470 [bacterium]|nr:hypothetical protein [bacterium]
MRTLFSFLFLCLLFSSTFAQDSVDVTFRYYSAGSPTFVHLAGEFNNWANNSNGTINPGSWTMTKMGDGSWEKTVRLEVGGGSGPDGSYQYKFNLNGQSDSWLADPLNPYTYGGYGNSIIYVRRPTILHLRADNGPILTTDSVRVLADVFPVVGMSIDTEGSRVLLDGAEVATFGSQYDAATHSLDLLLTDVEDGEHVITLVAVGSGIEPTTDSISITVQSSPLQWFTRDNPGTYRDSLLLEGYTAQAGVTDIIIVSDNGDTLQTGMINESFFAETELFEGDNVFTAHGMKDGSAVHSVPLIIHRWVDHAPKAVMQFGFSNETVSLNGFASTDPDGDHLAYSWKSEDEKNPAPLNINQSGPMLQFPAPSVPGEYYFTLEVLDPMHHTSIARNYIRVSDGEADPTFGRIDENPAWVRDAIVYEIFVPAYSSDGDLEHVMRDIPRMKALGVNTIWLMPIMNNPGSINSFNGGYSIIDFYTVDESIGTIADYDALIDSAHANDMRVILDITPNHVHENHRWVQDIREWGDYSSYRSYIENRVIGDDRGLGQSIVTDNGYALYARYSNWSLANLNLGNEDTRRYMMDVYRFWLMNRKADGFRLDVYWGPQNRYGEKTWWRPFREEIKRYKPDAMILGETDGTGTGSEVNYADGGGACDAGYDWNWYGQIKTTMGNGVIDALDDRTRNYSPNENYNHYTGPNAHYFRFMENHDETRVAELFNSRTDRTKPGAAVMFSAPGIPMLYAGQEVGWKGQRNTVDFVVAPRPDFFDYYRDLISIRKRFSSLRSPRITRIANGTPGVYSFLRPASDENLITTANFTQNPVTVTVDLAAAGMNLSSPLEDGMTYYLNDMLADSTFALTREQLASFSCDLLPFQSRILLFSDSAYYPIVTGIAEVPAAIGDFALEQLYPNPLTAGSNGTLRYTLGGAPGSEHEVTITVFDALGREVLRTPALLRSAGTHSQPLRTAALPAGHYRLRMESVNQHSGSRWTSTGAFSILR